ncbi:MULTISPECIES: hypothetical protein [unclassified Streptomyces]|uniref:hypothetical protein n=1 Tax=unclassified Streptomyces TaxID=2593676 RepID=UPI0033208A19
MRDTTTAELQRVDSLVETLRALDATDAGKEALSMAQALTSPIDDGADADLG